MRVEEEGIGEETREADRASEGCCVWETEM